MRSLTRYRLLIAVYVLAALRATWELTSPDPEADRDPVGFNEVVVELYPDRAESLYQQGVWAMSFRRDPQEARTHLERALATGVKTNESLFHNYAVILVMLNEDPSKVDAAVADWRRNFPFSNRPDPRSLSAGRATPRQK